MGLLQQLDGNWLIGIQKTLNTDWLTPIMIFITKLGEGGYLWIAICLLLLVFKKTRRLGILCSLSLLFAFISCNVILKPIIDRTRPWIVFKEVHAFLPHPGDSSFPSGHSTNFMAPSWALYLNTLPIRRGEMQKGEALPSLGWGGESVSRRLMHRLGIVAVILAILVGFSRLYLGMHFPTDVIGGLLLGIVCATIIAIIIRNIENKKGVIGERIKG
ncbi:MAG: phosphatase PAP2 family protein [Clostridiales bacterium]|nr:phosphatase PAP2 family protein [Clostridiales bacterium]